MLLLHTTEGNTVEDALARLHAIHAESHQVVCPITRRIVQLIPFGQPARSLVHITGQPDTNNRVTYPVQIEIVARAEQFPTMFSTDDIAWLAAHLVSVCEQTGTPVVFPYAFPAYPSSWGPNNGVRLSFEEWATAEGVLGHCHVPENDHGDPGDISTLITAMEAAVAITPDDANLIAEAVWNHAITLGSTPATALQALGWEWQEEQNIKALVAAVKPAGAAPADPNAIAAAVVGLLGPSLAAQVAKVLGSKLAA